MQKASWTVIILGTLLAANASGELKKKSEGRAADPSLKVKQSGVPQYEIYQKKKVGGKTEVYRVKNIPRLNIGEEASFQSAALQTPELPAAKKLKLTDVKKRPEVPTVSIEKALQWAGKPVTEPKVVSDPAKIAQVPFFQEPLPVQDPSVIKPELNQVEIKDLTPVELKMLQALIFLEIQKNYPMALGLFAELLDEAPEFRTEATYNLALTGKGLGLYSEYRHQMLKVLDDKKTEWQKRAALSLVESSAEGDTSLVSILDPKLEKFKIELEKTDQYQLNRAKYYLAQDDLKTAIAATEKIMMNSPLYNDALFLKGVLLYKSGQPDTGILTVASALAEIEKKAPQSELKSIAALTLARLYFQTADYKSAFQTYLKIDKTHPEWPTAMIEQAWSQILAGDHEGAAGNMFSLHTDFFKNTFAPESYVVRTVGYLNLCQFGDGARVVQDMKKRYTPVQERMQQYQSSHKSELEYYETVKRFMKDGTSKEIDGLPRGFVWALARHPSFMLEQKNINSIEDQVSRYNRITMDLIKREKFLLADQALVRNRIIELKKKLKPKETTPEIADLEKRLLSFKIQHFIVKKARTSIKDVRAQGLARIDKEKQERKVAAGKALTSRFQNLLSNLTTSLDQTDVLQYELFAGAGEHLRYQAAGGDIDPKQAKGLKPEENRQLKWEFKGEVWEDELGHYRSSLKNVCPEVEDNGGNQVSSVDNK